MLQLAISKENITKVVLEAIAETDIFLVEVTIGSGNNIEVLIDSPTGINVRKCVTVNRAVEAVFDRDVEDYALDVASPGADRPFKVTQQYHKNVGREVEVTLLEGKPESGTLTEVTEEGITISRTEKKKIEGKKKKEEVTEVLTFSFPQIKSTKIILKF